MDSRIGFSFKFQLCNLHSNSAHCPISNPEPSFTVSCKTDIEHKKDLSCFKKVLLDIYLIVTAEIWAG